MTIKSVYELYLQALVPLSPKSELVPLLKAVLNCGETTKDFVWALRNDHELQGWLRHTVVAMGFESKNLGLEQIITLMGQDKVRDILLGRSIEEAFTPASETLMAKHQKNTKKKAPSKVESQSGDEQPLGDPPPVAEFASLLVCAKRSEEVANTIRDSYPWQAFIGGLLFDYLSAFVKSKKFEAVEGLKMPSLLNSKTYVESVFFQGLRSAVASHEVLQKISIKHQKNVFITSLLHSCGKLILLGFDPLKYQTLLEQLDLKESLKVTVDIHSEERKYFCLDHSQATSLYLGRLPFMAEIERVCDFAGAPKMLRMRDSNLYALHCVVKIGSELASMFHKGKSSQGDILKMNDQSIKSLDEFSFLKLDDNEWKSIKSNFALKIMKVNL